MYCVKFLDCCITSVTASTSLLEEVTTDAAKFVISEGRQPQVVESPTWKVEAIKAVVPVVA